MAKDILNEPRNKAALDAVARYVPTMPLPVLPPLQNDLWRIHSSAKGAPRREFELLEGEKVTDYERLEVRPIFAFLDLSIWLADPHLEQHVGDALLGAEVTLLIHEKYPKLSAGARTVAKSVLVCNLTLSLLAVSFHLEKQILSAVAQAYSHMTNPYIQACIFESAIAALYEEHGADALRDFLRAIYSQLLPVVVEALRPFYTSQAEDALPSRNFVGSSTLSPLHLFTLADLLLP